MEEIVNGGVNSSNSNLAGGAGAGAGAENVVAGGAAQNPAQDESFEQKLDKIERLLAQLNNENLNLQESVKLYKEGMGLVFAAREMLENAKLVINEVDLSKF